MKKLRKQTITGNRKQLSLLLAVTLAFFVASSPANSPFFGVMVDDLGRSVKIEKVPQSIISLSPSNTEILFALGLEDKVVGVTEQCNYPHEALGKAKVGRYASADIERIITLQPDLILAESIHAKEVIPALERSGLTVFILAPEDFHGLLKDIKVVGKITGKEGEADRLITQMGNRIKAITGKSETLQERPRVFYLSWHDPMWTAGWGTLEQELIEKAGGINMFQDISGYKIVDFELVLARNPEVIITCTGHEKAKDTPLEWVKTEPRLHATEARKSNKIYQIDADLITRAGPRIVDGLEWFAYFIHPEVFGKPEVVR